jgi:hypothetical protein
MAKGLTGSPTGQGRRSIGRISKRLTALALSMSPGLQRLHLWLGPRFAHAVMILAATADQQKNTQFS